VRGYAAIGLDRPKCPANLGGVLRAAGVYGASLVMVSGDRMGRFRTDTMRAYKHLPCMEVADLLGNAPFGSTPVVVEIVERAKPLFNYIHPESAFYIFGPEDGGVRKEIVERCQHVVRIPTNGCMNLAATVNVVLYDRLSKQAKPK
jgi:tRNA(Leu) C34 or U34 (ribose-2'-O)-methylase TrmL